MNFYQHSSAKGLKKNAFARSMTENHLAPCTTAAVISGILTRKVMFVELQHLMLWNPQPDASFYLPLIPAIQGNYTHWVIALALLDPPGY